MNPGSYVDQIKKYLPKEAPMIMRVYGWEDKSVPKVRKVRLVVCERCGEEFIARNGRQLFCLKNSKGDNCSRINKYAQAYLRKGLIYVDK